MSPRKRHSNFSRRVLWLAILALMLQVLLPVIHQPPLALAGQLSPTDAQNICFAPGSVPAKPSDGDKSADHHVPPCAVCQAMHAAGGLVPPTAFILAERPFDAIAFPPSRDIAFRLRRANSTAQARAPPQLT